MDESNAQVTAYRDDNPDYLRVGGPQSTDFIPRVWGERMLTLLREEAPAKWRSFLGRASLGQ